MGKMSEGGGDGVRLNVKSIYNKEIRCVVCSKCGQYVDADYFGGMIKVAPCECVKVKA
mgnify:FL=1